MIRWEYKVENSNVLSLEKLAALGQLGWELVTVVQTDYGNNIRRFYLKRPIEDETDK